jgi:hypothetical protein
MPAAQTALNQGAAKGNEVNQIISNIQFLSRQTFREVYYQNRGT